MNPPDFSEKSTGTPPVLQPAWQFVVVGLATILLYGLLCAFFQNHGMRAVSRGTREILLWVGMVGFLGLYFQGYRLLKQTHAVPFAWLIGGAVIIGALAWLTPPFHSTDLYGYINRGWQQAHYGLNPYVTVIDQIPNWRHDPMLVNHWVNNPSPYGFLFVLIAKYLCVLGGGNFQITLLLFKGLNLLLHLGCGILIWLGARRLGYDNPKAAAYLYWWNPLILLHAVANGHNDIVMAFLVLAACVLALYSRWAWVLPLLIAGVLIKYTPIVALPIAVLWLWRESKQSLFTGLVLSVCVFLAAGAAYLPDWQHFQWHAMSDNLSITHSSLHSFVFYSFKEVAKHVAGWPAYRPLVYDSLKMLLVGAYALFYAGLIRWLWQQRTASCTPWVMAILLAQWVLITIVSNKFYPWYIGMMFPLALLLPAGNWLRRWVLLASATELFAFTFLGQTHFLNYLLLMGLPTALVFWQMKSQKLGSQTP